MAHWHAKAREAGYNPAKFRDAKPAENIRAIVGLKHMRGATIGDPEACSGSRCLRDVDGIAWAYVGAWSAFVAFTDGRLRRYRVSGLPLGQDRTMNVAGEEIRLLAPSPANTMKANRERNKVKPRGGGANKSGTGKHKDRERSIAAILRNTDEALA